jgi:hypothetical protein
MIVLGGRIVGGLVSFPHGIELFGRVEGIVGMTRIHELLRIFFIHAQGFPFALPVRAKGAGLFRAFIRFQPAPFQAVHDIFLCACHVTALVGIFDPEDECAAMTTGKKIIIKYGPYAA